jgi:hypothetical protein
MFLGSHWGDVSVAPKPHTLGVCHPQSLPLMSAAVPDPCSGSGTAAGHCSWGCRLCKNGCSWLEAAIEVYKKVVLDQELMSDCDQQEAHGAKMLLCTAELVLWVS